MRPNFDKIRQLNINRIMHAESIDQKEKNRNKPGEPSNTIMVKKESSWKKGWRKVKHLFSRKTR
ncbi:hypothetical protein [Atopococcus tabaci]|uniref:hypothetical protein n=1 Tax=Atopococcus tabaci TaxID=269774 RepID=UPI0003FAFE88|nr:hypothetical protein [Atopococcus tabaci]